MRRPIHESRSRSPTSLPILSSFALFHPCCHHYQPPPNCSSPSLLATRPPSAPPMVLGVANLLTLPPYPCSSTPSATMVARWWQPRRGIWLNDSDNDYGEDIVAWLQLLLHAEGHHDGFGEFVNLGFCGLWLDLSFHQKTFAWTYLFRLSHLKINSQAVPLE